MITLTAEEIADIKNRYPADGWVESCLERPIQEISLNYYFKRANKKWPNQIFVYVMSPGASTWIGKKAAMTLLTSRSATRDECIEDHFRMRFRYMIYNDWSDLIMDEVGQHVGAEFIAKLEELSAKHPL